jgi:hypothetical protein
MTHIQELRDVIHHLHGVHANHVESVAVTERFQGKTVWDGIVEVFDLKGHPKTHRVYAWIHDTGDPAKPKRHVTVLHIPPVVSPQTAVKAAIVQEFKDRAKAN